MIFTVYNCNNNPTKIELPVNSEEEIENIYVTIERDNEVADIDFNWGCVSIKPMHNYDLICHSSNKWYFIDKKEEIHEWMNFNFSNDSSIPYSIQRLNKFKPQEK